MLLRVASQVATEADNPPALVEEKGQCRSGMSTSMPQTCLGLIQVSTDMQAHSHHCVAFQECCTPLQDRRSGLDLLAGKLELE